VIAASVRLCSARETSTSGGCNDTEVKAFTVHPIGCCPNELVTMVTPVAQLRMKWRKLEPLTAAA